MKSRVVSGIMLTMLAVSMVTLAFNIQSVRASETIYIRPDGSVDPSTAPIRIDGDIYTFTGNIYDSIVVERDNIVVDGASYVLQGSGEYPSKGIDLSSRSNVTIKNIEINTFYYGIYLYGSSNNTISGNSMTNNSFSGVYLDVSSSNNTISGNDITNNGGDGIELRESSDNIISGNNITNNNWDGVYIASYSDNNLISGNIIADNGDGVYIVNRSNNNIISGNNITNNGHGVDIGSPFNTVSGNNITNNGLGVDISSSSNIISGNNITRGTGDGVYIASYLDNNLISGNIIADNGGDGVYIAFLSNNNIISGNNITNNDNGVGLFSSYDNVFHHNYFIDNNESAYISYFAEAMTNVWDDGYPSGGNYWSDYNGTDFYSGPYQNETSSDGIGDTPYAIDGANIDRYPLFLVSFPSLTIVTESLPANLFGQFSSHYFFAAGGVSPYSWSLVNGTLPPGMNFSSDGILNGTPTAAGNFTFTVSVTDSNSSIDEKTFTKQVFVTLPPPQICIKKFGTTPVPGRIVYYFILVENVGNVIAQDVEVVEILEPWFFFLSSDPEPVNLSVVTYTITNATTNETIGNLTINNSILWEIPSLMPGEMKFISYRVELHPGVPIGFEVVGGKLCRERKGEPCWEKFKKDVKLLAGGCTAMCIITTTLEGVEAAQAKSGYDLWKKVGGEIFGQQMPSACIGCLRNVGTIAENRLQTCLWTTYPFSNPDASYCGEDRQTTRRPKDPNEKLVIADKFIQQDQTLVYPIHFENIGNISALDVFVTDTLVPNLNLSTLQILAPNGTFILLPENEIVTLVEQEKNKTIIIDDIPVNITIFEKWTVTLQDRTVFWNLSGIDLSPNATGEVILSVKPLQGLLSGTEIRNNATIQFEIFETITTNDTVNIIDDIPPNSVVNPLPNETSTLNFTISWKGTDTVGEIDFYTIFVSVDGGGFTRLVSIPADMNTTINSTIINSSYTFTFANASLNFAGEPDTDYGFIVIASDKAGNVEVKTPVAEAVTHTPSLKITISSPENDSYRNKNYILLNFMVNAQTSWIGYSLDNQPNVTITEPVNLTNLADGSHNVKVFANDVLGNMGSSDIVYFTVDTVSPNIEILSPENDTYTTSSISLGFTVDEATSWIGYSLDGQANVTITGNTTISGLSDGSHSIIIYAKDAAGNTGASGTIHFSIETPPAEPFPIWIVAVIVIIAAFGTAVYLLKIRKKS